MALTKISPAPPCNLASPALGTKIFIVSVPETEYNSGMALLGELDQRAWYRFLKLCYAFLYFICIALVVG